MLHKSLSNVKKFRHVHDQCLMFFLAQRTDNYFTANLKIQRKGELELDFDRQPLQMTLFLTN